MLGRGAVVGLLVLAACGSGSSTKANTPPPTGTAIDPAVSETLSANLADEVAHLSGAAALSAQAAAVALQAGVQASAVTLTASAIARTPSGRARDALSKGSALSSGSAQAFAFQLTVLNSPQGASSQVYSGVLLFQDAADAALAAGLSPGSAIPPAIGLILSGGTQLWEASAGQESAQLVVQLGSCPISGLPAFITACNLATFSNAGFAISASTPLAGGATGSPTTSVPNGSLVGAALTLDCSRTSLCAAVTSVAVSVSPPTATLPVSGTQQFTAAVTGTSNTNVTWSVVEEAGGAVSSAGLYTAPATAGTYHVHATSVADPAESGLATVTVNPATGNPQPPSNLTYSANPAVYSIGVAIPANTPSSTGGAVTSYSVAPALPMGLVLNATTGVISGTPTSVTAASSFIVTASNSAGSTTLNLSITVDAGEAAQETVRVEFPPTITEYAIPTTGALPMGIAAGPDGNLWFTEHGASANNIGRITTSGTITEYPIPTAGSGPLGIAKGPDGNLWFTEEFGDNIGSITPAGMVTEYAIPNVNYGGVIGGLYPYGIAAGPDGNLWFTGTQVNTNQADIGRITTGGTFTLFQLPVVSSRVSPEGIVAGPDGNLWFTEAGGNQIGTITTGGSITEYPGGNEPISITAGPDGNLWVGEFSTIAVITTGGTLLGQYPDCTSCQADGIVTGPDGNLWFTDFGAADIGSISTSSTIAKFPILTPPDTDISPYGIAVGSDGNLWFTEYGANMIGRITLPPVVVPSGIACILVQAAPMSAGPLSYSFDVAPGSTSVLTLSGLPPGSTFFSAKAFSVPCAETGDATPTDESSGVTATVTAGTPAGSVTLLLTPL